MKKIHLLQIELGNHNQKTCMYDMRILRSFYVQQAEKYTGDFKWVLLRLKTCTLQKITSTLPTVYTGEQCYWYFIWTRNFSKSGMSYPVTAKHIASPKFFRVPLIIFIPKKGKRKYTLTLIYIKRSKR